MTRRYARFVIAILLAVGLGGLRPHLSFAAGTTVSGCPTTEAALSSDITSAGDGGTVAFTCAAATTIPFTSPVTISQSVTLDAGGSSGTVTFDGGGTTQLLVVNGGVSLTLKRLSLARGNAASSYGGAIFNYGTVTIANSTLSGNSAPGTAGGAIGNDGTMIIVNSTLSGNSAQSGGAIINAGTMNISNSTLSNNSADFASGAIFNAQVGTLTITNSTLSGNSASDGGGAIFNKADPREAGGGGKLQIGGSILANNTGGSCGNAPIDLGYNLSDDSSCGFSAANHDLTNTNPQLGPLANNGGPTQTMALAPTSPAVDTIPAGTLSCAAGGTDQRGQSRPDVGEQSCDMGAYEYQDPLVLALSVSPTTVQRGQPVAASATLGNPTTSSQTVTVTVTLTYSGNSTVKLTLPYSLTLAAGQTLAKTATVTVPSWFPTGTYTLTVTAADSAGSATSSASLTVT